MERYLGFFEFFVSWLFHHGFCVNRIRRFGVDIVGIRLKFLTSFVLLAI